MYEETSSSLFSKSGGGRDSSREVIAFKHGNNVNEIEVVRELGRGAFGQVLLATDERGAQFAVKKIACYDANSYFTTAQELRFLTTLKHKGLYCCFYFLLLLNICTL